MIRRSLRPLAGALVALAALALPTAASAQIDGDTLDLFADGQGRLQIIPTGSSAGVFAPPASTTPDAGIEATVNGAAIPLGSGRATISGPTLTPLGPASTLDSVYTLTTGGAPQLQVTEQLGYVNGQSIVTGLYTIENVAGTALANVRIGALARLADDSVGQLVDTPPARQLYGISPASGLKTGLIEDTLWTAFQEGASGSVFANFQTAALNNTVNPQSVPSAIGAEWNLGTMEPGQQSQITFGWYVEQGAADVPQPELGKSVVAVTSRGKVRVRLPGSRRYVDLTSLRELPMGTTFDTTQGRVTLTSAADPVGGTQKAWFYQGIFKIGQTRGAKPVTRLAMAGPKPSCAKSRRSTASKRKAKSRRLWGDGTGRFQTKGQFSAATVRGTKWLVQDTCRGTLTKVVRGSVTVRDFVRKRNVVVKAGRSYLAKRPN